MARIIWSVLIVISVIGLAHADDTRSVQVRARQRIAAERPHKWALVIGVNDYASEEIVDLRYAVADARAIYRLLVDPAVGGFDRSHSKLLVDGADGDLAPTRNNILHQLVQLERLVSAEDTVLVYFSGHGIEDMDKPVLLPSDVNFDILGDTGVPVDRIHRLKRKTGCKVLITILDACHSGVRRDKSGDGRMTDDFRRGMFEDTDGMAVMSSTDLDQSSFENEDAGHGLYTSFLMEALAGRADAMPGGNGDGVVTVVEAHGYVGRKLREWSFASNKLQTPRLDYNATGDILLTLSPLLPQEATSILAVVTEPAGAKVYTRGPGEDTGTYRGMTPCELAIVAGEETLVVALLEGHGRVERLITLARRKKSSWQVDLRGGTERLVRLGDVAPPSVEPIVTTATLRVEGANGVRVFMDGQRVGTAPCEITVDLGPLQHKQVEVVAQRTGYRSTAARVTLQRGRASIWRPELARIMPTPTPTPAPTPSPQPTGGKPWERPGSRAGQEIVAPGGIALLWVPDGNFMMGREDDWKGRDPVHRVELSGFWVGKTEVTVAQWRAVMGSVPPDQQGDSHPVSNVSWDDAKQFCDKLSLELPTEAQWEYAARGPESRLYPWGDEWDARRLCRGENRGMGGKTFPVGSFPSGASWCGALDMAGNVYEWCADRYDSDYYGSSPARDPAGPASGGARVLRGGSWNYFANLCRSALRGSNDPTGTYNNIGFRISRS